MQCLGIECHNCSVGHSGDVAENCLMWLRSSMHLVPRCLRSVLLKVKETHREKIHSGEPLGFSPHGNKSSVFFFMV